MRHAQLSVALITCTHLWWDTCVGLRDCSSRSDVCWYVRCHVWCQVRVRSQQSGIHSHIQRHAKRGSPPPPLMQHPMSTLRQAPFPSVSLTHTLTHNLTHRSHTKKNTLRCDTWGSASTPELPSLYHPLATRGGRGGAGPRGGLGVSAPASSSGGAAGQAGQRDGEMASGARVMRAGGSG